MAMPLDEILTFKHEVIHKLQNTPELIALMANDPEIDLASDEAATIQEEGFYDYSFTDQTFQSDRVVIFVEMEMTRNDNLQFKSLQISVQVVCNKKYAKLTPDVFKGMLGNRRDNICSVISGVLDNSLDFGIGRLLLTDAQPTSVPNGFTGYGMIFKAVDFETRDDDVYEN